MPAPSFRLAGIPITIQPVFFVIVGLLGLAYEEPVLIATWVGIAFASILLHELGHAVAFRAFGSQPRIVLHGFGGATTGPADLGPGRDIVVSLAGPMSVLVLVGLPALWLAASGTVEGATAEVILAQVVWINVGWSLLNLVPVLPLDGGAVTASVLELVVGDKGRRAANVVSIVVASGLALWALSYGMIFGAALCGFFIATNVHELGGDRRRAVQRDLAAARQGIVLGHLHAAEQLARQVQRSRRLKADEAIWARELVAWARLFGGDPTSAQDWMAEADRRPASVPSDSAWLPDAGPSASLRAAVALWAGDRDGGTTLAAWALVNDPRRAARPLVVLAADRAGVLAPLVEDLVALGDAGRPPLAVAREALLAAGRVDAAAWLVQRLTAPVPPTA